MLFIIGISLIIGLVLLKGLVKFLSISPGKYYIPEEYLNDPYYENSVEVIYVYWDSVTYIESQTRTMKQMNRWEFSNKYSRLVE